MINYLCFSLTFDKDMNDQKIQKSKISKNQKIKKIKKSKNQKFKKSENQKNQKIKISNQSITGGETIILFSQSLFKRCCACFHITICLS